MQIDCLKSVDSTQKYLKELLLSKKVTAPYSVVADIQTDGIGSRGNSWQGLSGNLFLSFAIEISSLPKDLKIESASIYFAYLLKETLNEFGSAIWLKWPNDFYLEDKKAGGMITNILDKNLICGVGLNLQTAPDGFAKLDISIERRKLLECYFENIKKSSSWKQVFSKYKLEFYKNQNFFTHNNNLKIPLENVSLQDDGSIVSNGERIYSLR
ncbi:MAG: BirA family transcriptional regulator [Campylobacterota bacterium]|nr:BirA family transcriptional regulator [Campylobacterota bacterium]